MNLTKSLQYLLFRTRLSCCTAFILLFLGVGNAHASPFLPPVTIDENANFLQVISTNGGLATGGVLLICEGNPVDKSTFSATAVNPLFFLCGNTLPGFGISDIVAFVPGVGGLLIQMASDLDADAATTPADTTPIPFVFTNAPMAAIAEVPGPSGFIEYAPQETPSAPPPFAPANPGFYIDPLTGLTPLYYIQSDCNPAENIAAGGDGNCGIHQIQPQCGDPCATVFGSLNAVDEPPSLILFALGLAVLLLSYWHFVPTREAGFFSQRLDRDFGHRPLLTKHKPTRLRA